MKIQHDNSVFNSRIELSFANGVKKNRCKFPDAIQAQQALQGSRVATYLLPPGFWQFVFGILIQKSSPGLDTIREGSD